MILDHVFALIHNLGDRYTPYFDELWQQFHSPKKTTSAESIRCILRFIILDTLIKHHETLLDNQLKRNKNRGFFQLKQLIDTHYRKTRNVATYAEIMGKTPKQINKIAKDNTGRTGKELIDDRVVLELKRLLAYSEYSITEIANLTGFNEATNMTKFFRRHTRLSPRDFRELSQDTVGKMEK